MNQNGRVSTYPSILRLTWGPLAFLVFAFSSSVGHSQILTATDLGTLASDSYASSLNNFGTVTGSYAGLDGYRQAFSYSNGTMTAIGALGWSASLPTGINDSDTIVGWGLPGTLANSTETAFSYASGITTNLGTLGGTDSQAYGINNAGTIVGYAYTTQNNAAHAFSYSNGVMTDLGTLGGRNSSASAINANGTIVGFSERPMSASSHAFSYSHGLMTDLGTLGGNTSYANAINNAGVIVGGAMAVGDIFHAFSSNNGKMVDLGTLGGSASEAYSINAVGTIVGYADTSGGLSHAFSYSNGIMTDLNSLASIPPADGYLVQAMGINDLGQIIANSSNGHAFLLTPIPEPSFYAACLGLLTFGAVAIRRTAKAR